MIAITILIVGMSALAALVARSLSGTGQSHYLSMATTLASEKLEDLNRWSAAAPQVAAGGSLTSDSPSGSIDYFDDVDMSVGNGQVSESIASTSGGTTTYTNIIHNVTGYIDTTPSDAAPSTSGVMDFHRRWLIESDPIVNGIKLTGYRRVTVLVTLNNSIVQPPVSFQMSLIRP
jgi:Tfp pilus assembly protein PilV